MYSHTLYSAILGLSSNWNIYDISEDKASGLMVLHIKSNNNGTLPCCTCGTDNIPTLIENRRWLYNNKLNIRFYVSLDSPHIHCKICGNNHTIAPWDKSLSIQSDQHISNPINNN